MWDLSLCFSRRWKRRALPTYRYFCAQMASDAWKLGTVFTDHNTNFKNTDSAFNVITEKILDLNLAKVFLNGEAIAERHYIAISLMRDYLVNFSVWELLQKTKFAILI